MFISKKRDFSALTIVVFATMLFGTNAVALKVAVETMDPLLFASLRFLAVGVVLLLFIKNFAFLKNGHVLIQLFIASCMILVFVASHALGVAQSGALKASIFSLVTPVFVYIFSVSMLHEPLIKRVMFGGIVSLMGSLLLVGLPAILGQSLARGDLFLLIAYIALAASVVDAKYLYKWLKPTEILGIRFTLSGLALLVFVLIVHDFSTLPVGDPLAWSLLLYGIVVTGVIGNSLYYKALNKIRAEDAAPIFYLDPMVGAVGAALLLGERLDPGAIVGMGIIVAGVLLAYPHHNRLMHHYHVHTPRHPLGYLRSLVKSIKL